MREADLSRRDESAFARWSRRKHEARKGGDAATSRRITPAPETVATDPSSEPAAGDEPPAQTPAPAPAAVGEDSAPAPAPDELPDVETLSYESDFTVFLREGVPDLVRRQALRKLWSSAPVLANLDGLNDYDPERSTFLTVLEEGAEALAGATRGVKLPDMGGAVSGVAGAEAEAAPAAIQRARDDAGAAAPPAPRAAPASAHADGADEGEAEGQASAPGERT